MSLDLDRTLHLNTGSAVLAAYGSRLNEVLPADKLQRLVPVIPALVDTRDDGLDPARSYMALDWLIRTHLPVWLDLAHQPGLASALRDLSRINDMDSATVACVAVLAARNEIAELAQPAKAWMTETSVGRRTIHNTGWDAAAGAAFVTEPGRYAASAARVGVAWAVAQVAARSAAVDGRAAHRFARAVDQLQDSAVDLFAHMIAPTTRPKYGEGI
jgi:hypothetical protein